MTPAEFKLILDALRTEIIQTRELSATGPSKKWRTHFTPEDYSLGRLPKFNTFQYEYRIKPPEPVEVYVNFYPAPIPAWVHTSKEEAERSAYQKHATRVAVRMREVVDDA